jgi:uncharacterized protein YgiM (DUF1202 family)
VNTFTSRARHGAVWSAATLSAALICLATYAADAPRQGTLKADRVNVRVAPHLQAETLTQLNKGASVRVLEEKVVAAPAKDGAQTVTWLRIAVPEQAKLYVHKEFVANGEVTASTLHVRSGPSNRHAIVATLPRGTKVEVLETKGNWLVIKPPAGASAWVAAQYIEVAPAAAVEPKMPEVAAPQPKSAEPPRPVEFVQREGVLRFGVLLPADENAPAGATHKLNVHGTTAPEFTLCYIKCVKPDLRPDHHIGKPVRIRGLEIWERGRPCPLMEVDFLQRDWNAPTSSAPKSPIYGW